MPLYRPRTWTIPSSPGLHACAIPPFTCLMQALYMDTSALYGSLCMNNSAIYGPYTGPAHGQFRPLRTSMHRQFLHLRALYTPCTWTLPPSTGLYAWMIPPLTGLIQALYMHKSALYGLLCMGNSLCVALYKPRTLTNPASTGIFTRTNPCQWPLYRPCTNESLELWEDENESLELWNVHHFP